MEKEVEVPMEIEAGKINEKHLLGQKLVQSFTNRDTLFSEIEAMYHMEWR
jgi:hypothetical protein